MSPGSCTESYPAFVHIELRENPGKNLNQVTRPDRDANPGHLVSLPDALTVTPQKNSFEEIISSTVVTKKKRTDPLADFRVLFTPEYDRLVILRRFINILGYLASECDNAGEMSPGSNTEIYPAFIHIGLRETLGKNPQQNNSSRPGIKPRPSGFAARRANRYSTAVITDGDWIEFPLRVQTENLWVTRPIFYVLYNSVQTSNRPTQQNQFCVCSQSRLKVIVKHTELVSTVRCRNMFAFSSDERVFNIELYFRTEFLRISTRNLTPLTCNRHEYQVRIEGLGTKSRTLTVISSKLGFRHLPAFCSKPLNCEVYKRKRATRLPLANARIVPLESPAMDGDPSLNPFICVAAL
ncbi:hypothetical protein ANN_20645 [Periplaneta americana]|uniref:Uncharacterized protein n=1 Tax=Periplaneta americana TaxID=6978 RepID=A0ABQ8SDY6_PERAM|nr:hypothetical protein ANN_20645 [Periplaneta americana]